MKKAEQAEQIAWSKVTGRQEKKKKKRHLKRIVTTSQDTCKEKR